MLKCRTRQEKWSTWTEGAVKVYYAATHTDRAPHLHITRASIAVYVGNTRWVCKILGPTKDARWITWPEATPFETVTPLLPPQLHALLELT